MSGPRGSTNTREYEDRVNRMYESEDEDLRQEAVEDSRQVIERQQQELHALRAEVANLQSLRDKSRNAD